MRPRFQFRLRTLLFAVVIFALASAYLGSYYRLSRRGLREAREYGLAGFLYVPFEDAAVAEDLSLHYRLAVFYSPANWIDRQFFGSPGPTLGITWGLSQRNAVPCQPAFAYETSVLPPNFALNLTWSAATAFNNGTTYSAGYAGSLCVIPLENPDV